MTAIKICGLKRVEDALVAVEAGADMLGFVFAPSKRRVQPETAREIVAEMRKRSNSGHAPVKMVGVFVNASPEEITRITRECLLDYVQLSGDEPDEVMAALEYPVIKAIRVGQRGFESLRARINASPADVVLLDTAEAGSYGGTGRTFDWASVPALERPVMLAGGLHSGNVQSAIRALRPWGVDVSSGVETDGEKDQEKIRAFIAAVRANNS